jgi:hypothetical protein
LSSNPKWYPHEQNHNTLFKRFSLRIHEATTSDAACTFALHESGK